MFRRPGCANLSKSTRNATKRPNVRQSKNPSPSSPPCSGRSCARNWTGQAGRPRYTEQNAMPTQGWASRCFGEIEKTLQARLLAFRVALSALLTLRVQLRLLLGRQDGHDLAADFLGKARLAFWTSASLVFWSPVSFTAAWASFRPRRDSCRPLWRPSWPPVGPASARGSRCPPFSRGLLDLRGVLLLDRLELGLLLVGEIQSLDHLVQLRRSPPECLPSLAAFLSAAIRLPTITNETANANTVLTTLIVHLLCSERSCNHRRCGGTMPPQGANRPPAGRSPAETSLND